MSSALRRVPPTNLAIAVGVLVVLAVASYYRGTFIVVGTLVTGSTWALMAVGLSLVFGVMNVLNFAQGAFFMVGTLTSYLTYGWLAQSLDVPVLGALSPLLAILAAMCVGFLLGVLADVSLFRVLRRRSDERWMMNTFVLTMGISVVLIGLHQLVWGPNTKGIGHYWSQPPITFLDTRVTWDQLATVLISLVAIAVLGIGLKATRLGRAVRAVAQDERGAQLAGIDISRIHMVTLGIGCAVAALAGAALLYRFPSTPTVGDEPLAIAFTVVILADLGNVVGAIGAGFVVALLQTLSDSFLGATWQPVVTFALIVVILIFRPQGLFGRQVRGVWEQ